MYLGDFVGTETINHLFTTVQASGAPTTLAGTPKVRVYKNGSTTESSDITPTVDFDSRTGLNLAAIDLTGDSGFYATGQDYNIVITAGTVNSVSVVGYVVGAFSILHRSPLRPATAGRTLVVDANGLADANTVKLGPTGAGTAQTARDIGASVLLSSGTGTGQLDFTSGVTKANATQWLSGTIPAVNVTGVPKVDVFDWLGAGAPANTGDAFARLGAPVGVSISADIAEVEGETDTILTNTTGITFTIANQVDVNVVDWKGAAAPAMTGDAFARLGAPTGASIAVDIQEIETETDTLLAGVTVTTNNDKTGYSLTGNTAQTGDVYNLLTVAAQTELAAVPASTATLTDMLKWLFLLARNKITQTSTTQLVRNNADGATVGTSTVSDDATTFTRGKFS